MISAKNGGWKIDSLKRRSSTMINCGISDGKLQKGGRWKMEILFPYEWVNWGKKFLLSLSFCLFLPIR